MGLYEIEPRVRKADLKAGLYLTDGLRLLRVLEDIEEGVLLMEDCRTLNVEWFTAASIVGKLKLVRQ